MDPLTVSLHECSRQFIPYMTTNYYSTTIQHGNAQYLITITKQPDAAIPVFVPASVLGKRTFSSRSPSPIQLEYKQHRCDDYSPLYNPLYPEFGHNFK
jgi:hypothetical protein